ncbi:hypothetical protein [Mycobacterium phage WXIN]|nr:hypothetical protein [Mycobacterium phage WXIN]
MNEEYVINAKIGVTASSMGDAAEVVGAALMEHIDGHLLAAQRQARVLSVEPDMGNGWQLASQCVYVSDADFQPSQFKIWYTHQVPGPAYEQEVESPEVGQKILDAIYAVALYQYDNKMIPDYANTGGVIYLDPDGDWIDYHPEDWE